MEKVFFKGSGYFLPEKVVSNFDLEKYIDTSNEFIIDRTGVRSRRHALPEQGVSDLMLPAIFDAISNASIDANDIDMIIVNTLSPDFHDPSQACLIQSHLNIRNIPSFDIRAQCSGFLYLSDIASQFIQTKKCSHILVVCGEVLSKRIDSSNEGRNLSILLGDGASAFVLSSENSKRGFIDIITKADGHYFDLLMTKAPGSKTTHFIDSDNIKQGDHYFRLKGKPMFQHAVETLTEIAKEILYKNQLSLSDIDLVIPHQPNLRILEAVQKNLEIPNSKIVINVDILGNMASASLPVTISKLYKDGAIQQDMKLLLLTYGSGATWGAAIYQN